MTLAYQPVEIPIGAGIDEGTHDHAIAALRLKTLKNGRFRKLNSISKRYGYAQLDGVTKVKRMFSHDDQLCAIHEGTGAYALRTYANANTLWTTPEEHVGGDRMPSAVLTERRDVSFSGQSQGNSDGVVCNGQRLVAWVEVESGGTRVRASVFDDTSGALLLDSFNVAASEGRNPRVIAQGTDIYIIFWDQDTPAQIACRRYDTTTRGWGAETTLVTDYSAPANDQDVFDVASVSAGANIFWVLAYKRNDAPNNKVVVKRFNGTTLTHTAVIDEVPTAIGVFGTGGEDTYVGWYVTGVGWRVAILLTADLTSVLAPATLRDPTAGGQAGRHITFQRISSILSWAVFDFAGGGVPFVLPVMTMQEISRTAGPSVVGNHYRDFYGWYLYSKAFIVSIGGTATYNVIGHYQASAAGQSMQPALAAICLREHSSGTTDDPLTIDAHFCRGEAFLGRPWSDLVHVTTLTDGTSRWFCVDAAWTILLQPGDSTAVSGPSTITLDYEHDRRWATARLGKNTYIAGGVLTYFDGSAVAEVGFHQTPDDTHIGTPLAGGNLTAGVYQWAVCFESVTSNAEIDRGTPTLAYTAAGGAEPWKMTVAANDKVTISLLHCAATRKNHLWDGEQRSKFLCVYRTEADGSVFYKDSGFILPSTAVFVSTQADADLRRQAKVYTYDGVLEHVAPPPCEIICAHRNRLFVVSSEDKKTIWFSKEHVDGEVPGFNEVNQITIQEGGDITGLASLDDKLIIFKSDSTYVLFGTAGPDDKGANSDFAVSLCSSDVGCRDWRSIAVIPAGVIRQSERGFHLLDRQLQDTYVGRDVEATLAAADNTVSSAVVLPKQREVRWTLPGTFPAILVYQYDIGAWSVDSVADQDGGADGVYHVALNHQDTYYIANSTTATYTPHYEVAGSYDDPAGVKIPTTVELAWIKTAGFQGFQRVRNVQLLGVQEGLHGLTVSLAYNYKASYDTTRTFTYSEMNAMDRWQPRVHVPRQKCESIRIKLIDDPEFQSEPGFFTSTAGYTLTGVQLDIGLKPGRMRVPAAHAK